MRNWMIWVGATAALLVGLALATQSDAGWFRHHRRGHDSEQMREHAYRAVNHLLSRVDASDEQHDAARVIVDETFLELGELRFDRRALHGEVVALISAETIDRDAIEALRVEKLASADLASRALIGGLVELAEVLTPEQRTQLMELAEGHHSWH